MSNTATHAPSPRAASLPASTIRRLNDAIEALIGLLDALAPDCDMEEDDPGGGDVNDEPQMDTLTDSGHPCFSDDEVDLGATEAVNQDHAWATSGPWYEDRESDGCEDDLPVVDPSAEIRDAQTAKLEQVRDRLREVTGQTGRASAAPVRLDDISRRLPVAG